MRGGLTFCLRAPDAAEVEGDRQDETAQRHSFVAQPAPGYCVVAESHVGIRRSMIVVVALTIYVIRCFLSLLRL
jgi:hypothetical protein